MLTKGRFVAKLAGASEDSKSGIVVYETQKGALCAAIPCVVNEGDMVGEKIKTTMTIVKSDGTLMERTISTLKEVFGWDGQNPFDLMDNSYEEVQFQIEVEMEIGVDSKTGEQIKDEQTGEPVWFPKVKYLNPLGGKSINMPEAADRKSVLAKYGSKFRALSGGAPVKTPAKAPTAPPAKKTPPPAPPAPPAPVGPTATMEEAWAACCEHNQDNSEAVWAEVFERMFPGKTNSDLKPHDWGNLKSKFEDDIPA